MRRVLLAIVLSTAAAQAFAERSGSRLQDADSNQDGLVTKDEFNVWRDAQFVRRDRNGDGFLDEADFPRKRHVQMDADGDMAKRRPKMDADGDGKVSKAEFAAAPTTGFDAADKDSNGVLDAQEIAAAKERLRERRQQRAQD